MWRFMYHTVLLNNLSIIIGIKEERFAWTGIDISLLCNWYQTIFKTRVSVVYLSHDTACQLYI